MFRSTFLSLESERILPWATRMIAVQSRLPVRPYRLWVDPEVAGGFLIDNVLIGNVSVFPARGAIRASKFSIGQGDRLDGYVVLPDEYVTFQVTYDGPWESGACFRAAWAAVVVPLNVARTAREAGMDVDPGPSLGLEDLGTRIQHVPSLARASPPGFGWVDPGSGGGQTPRETPRTRRGHLIERAPHQGASRWRLMMRTTRMTLRSSLRTLFQTNYVFATGAPSRGRRPRQSSGLPTAYSSFAQRNA